MSEWTEVIPPAFTIYTNENIEAVRKRNHTLYYNSDVPRAHLESALAILQQGQILSDVTGVPLDTSMLAIQISHRISLDKTWQPGGYGTEMRRSDDYAYERRRSAALRSTDTGGESSSSQSGSSLDSPCQ